MTGDDRRGGAWRRSPDPTLPAANGGSIVTDAPPIVSPAVKRSLHMLPLLAQALVAPKGLGAQLPESALSVRGAEGEQIWWRSAAAPQDWAVALPAVLRAVRWRTLRPGLESGRLDLSGDGVAW